MLDPLFHETYNIPKSPNIYLRKVMAKEARARARIRINEHLTLSLPKKATTVFRK
jgi:hypothetical protein